MIPVDSVLIQYDETGTVLLTWHSYNTPDENGELTPAEPPTQENQYGSVVVPTDSLPDAPVGQMTVDDPDDPQAVTLK
ncbi:hypothetical protein [Haloarcula salina]|uniref:Uncharacterized protein n=1 Tax=Haloarcula salina TaxID=1429914 RepID=A0AA41KF95_9EURY|nr:hypothetical protein [Haloarcula salina]MBV0901827.1 hypothetical protein [Haloarcula salina]